MSSETPRIESFVLRFVADAPREDAPSDAALLAYDPSSEAIDVGQPEPAPPHGWHGVVVHVQTNKEKHFSNFVDAVAFISRYVTVGDFVFREGDGKEQAS